MRHATSLFTNRWVFGKCARFASDEVRPSGIPKLFLNPAYILPKVKKQKPIAQKLESSKLESSINDTAQPTSDTVVDGMFRGVPIKYHYVGSAYKKPKKEELGSKVKKAERLLTRNPTSAELKAAETKIRRAEKKALLIAEKKEKKAKRKANPPTTYRDSLANPDEDVFLLYDRTKDKANIENNPSRPESASARSNVSITKAAQSVALAPGTKVKIIRKEDLTTGKTTVGVVLCVLGTHRLKPLQKSNPIGLTAVLEGGILGRVAEVVTEEPDST